MNSRWAMNAWTFDMSRARIERAAVAAAAAASDAVASVMSVLLLLLSPLLAGVCCGEEGGKRERGKRHAHRHSICQADAIKTMENCSAQVLWLSRL